MLSTRLPCTSVSLAGAPAFRVSDSGSGGTEEQRAEHGLAYPADLELRGMAEQADPRPHRDAGAYQIGVGYLQGDGSHVTAGEDIAGRGPEDAEVVLPGCEPGEESGQGNPVGGEGIRGQPSPRQPAGAKGDDLAGTALAQQRPLCAVPRGGPVGAQDPHLLVSRVVRLGEGDTEGDVLAGTSVAGHDEFVERIRPEGGRR